MKKSRLLALTLVVAIALMGAGYAYWTQELTIENTVTTGELDVQFDDPDFFIPEYVDRTYLDEDASDLTWVSANDKYNLKLHVEDAYPGADFAIRFDLVNTGTLGAYVRDFGFVPAGDGVKLVGQNFVMVRGCTLDGDEVEGIVADTTLEDFFDILNGLNQGRGIDVEHEGSKEVVLYLEIDPSEDEDSPDIAEKTIGAVEFTLTSTAHQYNDLTGTDLE